MERKVATTEMDGEDVKLYATTTGGSLPYKRAVWLGYSVVAQPFLARTAYVIPPRAGR
jgi:hypothetical protein